MRGKKTLFADGAKATKKNQKGIYKKKLPAESRKEL